MAFCLSSDRISAMEWDKLLNIESSLRLIAFTTSLIIFSCLEALKPMKSYSQQRKLRWFTNYTIVIMNTLLLRLAFPTLAFGMASQWHSGLFHLLSMPKWVELILSVLLLDLIIYFQHRIFHKVPWLWRLHRVHHLDTVIDTSTALRFHPIEIALSMLIKMMAIMILGFSAESIIIFEIILSSSAIFNHANWNMGPVDSVLQKLLVTPNMHRIHHSINVYETNSNYGFFLSIWDQLFKTFTQEPSQPIADMRIGLEQFRSPKEQRLEQLMINPFL